MNRQRQWFFLAIVWGALFAFALKERQFVSYFLLLILTFYSAYSLLVTFLPLRRWQWTEQLQQKGDRKIILITVERPNRFPLGTVDFEITFAKDGMSRPKSFHLFEWVGLRKIWTYALDVTDWTRGHYESIETTLRLADSLRLSEQRRTKPSDVSFYVYPTYVPLHMESLMQSGLNSDGGTAALFSFEMTMPMSTRPYVRGDSLSHIHWKASARMQQMMTKEFERGEERRVGLYFYHVEGPYFEERVQLFSSLLYTLYEQQVVVEVIIPNIVHQLVQSESSFREVLRHLATVRPKPLIERPLEWNSSPTIVTTVATVEEAAVVSMRNMAVPHIVYILENDMDRRLERRGTVAFEWLPVETFRQLVKGANR